MATVEEVNKSIDDAQAEIDKHMDDLGTQVGTKVDKLNADLAAALASSGVPATALDAVKAKVDAFKADVLAHVDTVGAKVTDALPATPANP